MLPQIILHPRARITLLQYRIFIYNTPCCMYCNVNYININYITGNIRNTLYAFIFFILLGLGFKHQ